ncbi:DELLA protein RGL1-like [Corylus avellana]|uniref:DELLA protein RGL1-like n=1 Tax=Corylus avellana TaxID=13451 RepID=UPI00286D3CE0|nr:DELLA protein RGL1-like [Corylus avellana]
MENVGRLSAEQVMRVAEERFIHFSSQNCADDHVFSIAAPSGLSCQETKDVELACLLLASAEKRIDRETGRIAALKGGLKSDASHHEEKVYGDPTLISCYLHLPFSQVTQFAGIQAIVESVASVKRVHYIDLAIRNGVQSIVLMQALATRQEFPAEILKITAVGTTTSRQKIEETGKRLACFAKTLNLPFSFRTVVVRDIKDLNKGMFEIETKADELVAVNSPFLLNNMITKPSCLESLIKVLRDLDPCVMSYANRMALEATYSSEEIVNIVAAEGEDRVFRRMKIDAWRPFFAKFGYGGTRA